MSYRSLNRMLFILFTLLSVNLFAQYYNGISTSSATFVTDLQTLIRSNYTKLSYDQYDENMIPGFYAQDIGGGFYRVICVYTGYNYDYTGTFAWTTMSREHTWCHSWMPSYTSTSVEEYSDYHHLFPTNQNNANGVRNNHPLGIVQNISSSFLDGKYGKNSIGDNVYEPRDEQKGDAARALLYMALKYDGINGNDWDFNWLNGTRLPSLGEGEQSLQVLLYWHEQDPPDSWEINRNDYIYAIQGNRNPFIDHPEYVDYINFNDMSKTSPTTFPEPTNHILNFIATVGGNSRINLSWTENNGVQAPEGYLIKASTTSFAAIANPVDGSSESNDLDMSDGSGVYNISSGNSSFSWTGLTGSTQYFYKIFPYTNSSSTIDYKSDGSIPQDDETTRSPIIIINEVADHSTFVREYLELYNADAIPVSIDGWNITERFDNNNTSSRSMTLNASNQVNTGGNNYLTLDPGEYAILLRSEDVATFKTAYSISDEVAIFRNNVPQMNGNERYQLIDESSILIDEFGDWDHSPNFEIVAGRCYERINGANSDGQLSSSWLVTLNGSYTYTPGSANATPLPVELISFTASVNNDEVILYWETATELNNFGFEIHRAVVSGQLTEDWMNIGFVEGHGNSNSAKNYSYADNSVRAGQSYAYRLKQIDFDGKFKYSSIVDVEVSAPQVFSLAQNYPNPFNPSTSIEYTVPSNEYVSLKVYDVLGNLVSTLENENKEAGKYSITFDASNLTSGIYFYILSTANYSQAKKMMLVK